MAVSQYLYTALLNAIVDATVGANVGSQITTRDAINVGARRVIREVDLRSTKRRAALASKLFNDVFSYAVPSDLKAVIDIDPQANRVERSRLSLVSEQKFYQKKAIVGDSSRNVLVALPTDDLARRLLYASDILKDTSKTVAEFNSTTGDGGTWTAFSDASNVVVDTDNKISGSASLKFDLDGLATTAGLSNTGVTAIDITNYKDNGSVFVWVYINSTTNLTNWILRIGTDLTTNYYTQTVTTDAASNSFQNGWNLLRFDFASMTLNGTVTATAVNSIRLFMTKSSGKSDDGYRFDKMALHTGEYDDLIYYSKFAWQNTGGTFIENSTADTDYINADTDELEAFTHSGAVEVYRRLRDFTQMKLAEQLYQDTKKEYVKKNPSERIRAEDIYYDINRYHRTF